MSVMLSQWSKPGAATAAAAKPPAPLAVDPSQELLDGPGYFVEISQARFVTPANPRGWKYPEGQLVADRGWCALLPAVVTARDAGYTSVWLWEPTGQTTAGGGCMAYASPRSALDGWSKAMLDDFDDFCRISRDELHVKVIVYSGCAQLLNAGSTLKPNLRPTTRADIPLMVNDFAWFAQQGVSGIGLDALSLLQDKDPTAAVELATAVRADARTRALLLACEGWPFKGDAKLQAAVQQQYVSLDLLSNGTSVSDDGFARFAQRIDLAAEHSRVPGRRGAWLIHGASWTPEQLARAYQLCRAYGMTLIDWHLDRTGSISPNAAKTFQLTSPVPAMCDPASGKTDASPVTSATLSLHTDPFEVSRIEPDFVELESKPQTLCWIDDARLGRETQIDSTPGGFHQEDCSNHRGAVSGVGGNVQRTTATHPLDRLEPHIAASELSEGSFNKATARLIETGDLDCAHVGASCRRRLIFQKAYGERDQPGSRPRFDHFLKVGRV